MNINQLRNYYDHSFFYFNHTIDSENRDDAWSNFFLTPYHTLVRVLWNHRVVRHFKVNNGSGLVVEKIKWGPLVKGVPKYLLAMACVALVIPGLLLGAYYKRKALLDGDLNRSFMFLNMKSKYEQEVGLFTPLDKTQFAPPDKDTFLFILTFLDDEKTFKTVRHLCHGARVLIDTANLKALGNPKWLCPIDRNRLKGLVKMKNGENDTPMRLMADALEYQQKYQYSPAIVEGLEGFKYILKTSLLRVPELEKEGPPAWLVLSTLDKKALEKVNEKGLYSRAFRFRYREKEWLVARYALVIPSDMTKDGQRKKWERLLMCSNDRVIDVSSEIWHSTGVRDKTSFLRDDLSDVQLQTWYQNPMGGIFVEKDERVQKFLKFILCEDNLTFRYRRYVDIPKDIEIMVPKKDGSSIKKIINHTLDDCYEEISLEDWD